MFSFVFCCCIEQQRHPIAFATDVGFQIFTQSLSFTSSFSLLLSILIIISGITQLVEMEWITEEADATWNKVHIANVPIMLRSTFCILDGLTDDQKVDVGECPCDQVKCECVGERDMEK